MAFPSTLTGAIDGVTEIIAAHLNNLEAKVGVDGSEVVSSIDYLLKHAESIDPGHKHTVAGFTDLAAGDILYASALDTLAVLNKAVADNVLLSGDAPSWGKVSLAAMADMATGALLGRNTALAGIPEVITDIPTAITIGGAYVYRAAGTDVAVADGGTGLSAYTIGDLLYASATDALSKLAAVAVNQVLVSGGVGAAPAWSGMPTLAGITCTAINPLTTAAESWIGPSSTAGVYFKGSYVGIGTVTPSKKLHIFGDGVNAGGILLEGGDGGTAVPITIHSDKDYSWAHHSIFSDVDGNLTIQSKWQTAVEHLILQPNAGNVGIGTTVFGTAAAKVLAMGSGTAPTTAPADMAQMWVADINGAAGYAGLHKRTETTNLAEVVPGVVIKTDTGSPANPYEGLMEINTFDNKINMYADAAWRQLATW